MNMKHFFVAVLILLSLFFIDAFSQTSYQDEAMAQYYTGRDAYNSGNYKDAQYYFQRALILDPKIEALAQNIKFWLGISAFNNGDFKTARVNLELFPNAPIAVDLLKKIDEIEKNVDDYYFLNTDIYDERNYTEIIPVAEATQTENEQNSGGMSLTLILIVVWLVILAAAVLFEMKFGFFSRIAIRLVKKGSLKTSNLEIEVRVPEAGSAKKIEAKDESGEIEEDIPKALFDTPFEEEIDIEAMASRDIEEISRYFDEGLEEKEKKESLIDDVRKRMRKKQEKETVDDTSGTEPENKELSAREQILQTASEEYGDEEQAAVSDISDENDEILPDVRDMNLEEDESEDNYDGETLSFDEQAFMKKAFDLIEKAEEKATEDTGEEWKSIDELTRELEESEKSKDLNYFESMKEMSDEQREEFFDFVFKKTP